MSNERDQMSEPPRYRSHLLPRTRAGRMAVGSFALLFSLTQPPVVFLVDTWVPLSFRGVPFLFPYLLGLYVALIGVLVWARRRGL